MKRSGKMSLQSICGDTNARGQARSPLLELYTRSIFTGLNQKIPSELLPALARGQITLGKINAKNEDDEDEKLSTKPGQLQLSKIPTVSKE
jgi:hypothetical protein